MNLHYGTIVSVSADDGLPEATIRVGRALSDVSLALVADAGPGDTVLVCDGMAIGKVEHGKEIHVPCNTRQSH